jgi:hypothetical protein
LSFDYSRTSSLQIHLTKCKLGKVASSKSSRTNKKSRKHSQLRSLPNSSTGQPQTKSSSQKLEKKRKEKYGGAQQDSRRTTTLLEPKCASDSRPGTRIERATGVRSCLVPMPEKPTRRRLFRSMAGSEPFCLRAMDSKSGGSGVGAGARD